MKGHTKIELTDTLTGRVEVHEDDNMVTNALNNFLANFGPTNPTAFSTASIYNDYVTTLLGGILLLDTELEEDIDHVLLEGGVRMIGNGAYGVANNSAVTEMGSFNSNESGWQSDGSFVQVWDFSTSQANGTIACACLTSDIYGYIGAGNSSSNQRISSASFQSNKYDSATFSRSISGITVGIDDENNIISTLVPVSSNYNDGFKLRDVVYPISELDIRAGRNSEIVVSESNDIISLPVTVNAEYVAHHLGLDDNNGYFLLARYVQRDRYLECSNANPVHLLKFDRTLNTITLIRSITPSGLGYDFTLYHRRYSANGQYDIAVCHEGYIMIGFSNDPTSFNAPLYFLKIDVETGSVTEIQSKVGSMSPVWNKTPNTIYLSHSMFDMTTNLWYPINQNGYYPDFQKGCEVGNPLGSFAITYIQRNPFYLATINNLDVPVVKTADKTMKVTYRLTF